MGRLSSAGGEGGVAVDCGLRCAPCRKAMRWQAHASPTPTAPALAALQFICLT